MNLKWRKGTKRSEKSNAIDLLCNGLVSEDGIEREDWERNFEEVPKVFSHEEKQEWLKQLRDVVVSSDAFFPFADNIFRASFSGASYIAAPTGSQNDQVVFQTAEKLGITFIEQHFRLFHH